MFLLLASCSQELQEDDLYDFLNICNDEFYLDHGVLASEELEDFQYFLIDEGHLYDKSGNSLRVLLRELSKKLYFDPPLKKEDFRNALLYKNPQELASCVDYHYNIDSTKIASLPFYDVSQKIEDHLTEHEEVKIQDLFSIYAKNLSVEEFEKPYIKETVLLLLYRWYFSSKYNREIPIDFDELEEYDSGPDSLNRKD